MFVVVKNKSMNLKILIAFVLGGAVFVSVYYISQRATFLSQSSSTTASSNSCGPNGCGSNSMMHDIEITDEKGFILEMIPHHQEAIDTSRTVLAQTQDPELKKFTQDVINAQTAEVSQMRGWLRDWFNEEYAINSNYMPMMGDLRTFEGNDLEKVYVEGMIRHHQGAIEMARKVLDVNPRPEVKNMADGIISVQQSEVATLQGWLDTKYQDVDARDDMQHMMNIH